MTTSAPAKINLYLHVTGRRDDGYHELDSLVVFAALGDTVTVGPADGLELAVDGPFAGALSDAGDNLVLLAARALADAAGIQAKAAIRLTKRLPVAAGLGSGSADAAATLGALAAMWELEARPGLLDRIALGLGADVPACLGGRPAFVGGIGEELSPAPPLPPAWVVLANCGRALSTAAVFADYAGPFTEAGRFSQAPADAGELAALLADRRNDLDAPARRLEPAIGDTLAALDGCPGVLLARMSGSGATCFGLFGDEETARAAASRVGAEHPGWWVECTALGGDLGT
jgi:4-diphosphocytidyl-2-C-methyl-D-erythritol kinase